MQVEVRYHGGQVPRFVPRLLPIWILVLVGIVADVRFLFWYWPGSFFDGLSSSDWTGLAWNFAHGEFYRPLLGPSGYGGTRYMPLLFVIHGLLIRAGIDPIHAGVFLMQFTVAATSLALFAALRGTGTPLRLAVPFALTPWATALYQQYCTDLRADYLAAALALAGVACALHGGGELRGRWLAGAAAAVVLAGITKVTSIAFAAPIVLWLFATGKRGPALRFAAASGLGFAAAVAVVQVASSGHLLENFRAVSTGGMTWQNALPIGKLTGELVSEPFIGVPFLFACGATWMAAARRELTLIHGYLAAALLVTFLILISPGTVSNQLVDLQLAGALVVGTALGRGHLPLRWTMPAYGLLAVALALISWPVPWLPSARSTLEAKGPRPRAAVNALHAEFLKPGLPYLSVDPIVAVLADERPLLSDDFGLRLMLLRGAPAGRDVETRVREQRFQAIILREYGEFPSDMNAGDPDFARHQRVFWEKQDDPLNHLFRSTYEVRAVRKPFVVMLPTLQ